MPTLTGLELAKPNTNPYVTYLLTLYSQSQRSNSGPRGLDALSEQLYVDTALDRELIPAVLAGEFRLVLITGNAGDGKTAFSAEACSTSPQRTRSYGRFPAKWLSIHAAWPPLSEQLRWQPRRG